jgi:nucleoid-associated protein YgaU
MTSDAKVGLLLGLVFIVIIAFLINGLPNLLKGGSTDDIITNSVSEPNNNWDDLRRQADEAVRTVGGRNGDQRFRTTESFDTEIKPPKPTNVMTIKPPDPSLNNTTITPPKPRIPVIKKYKVVSGDNLSKIAVKMYGAEEGNRYVNINKIFGANKNILDSVDDVRIDQVLIIPPLNMQQFELVPMPPKPSKSVVDKIKNALKKIELPRYTTKDGDSLWSIAASELGDGSRYHEIVKLNKIEDEDTVGVGITLKLPKH